MCGLVDRTGKMPTAGKCMYTMSVSICMYNLYSTHVHMCVCVCVCVCVNWDVRIHVYNTILMMYST